MRSALRLQLVTRPSRSCARRASLDASAKASRTARRSLDGPAGSLVLGVPICLPVVPRNGTAARIGSVPGRAWGMLPLTPRRTMVDTGAEGAAGLDAGLGDDLARAALALA